MNNLRRWGAPLHSSILLTLALLLIACDGNRGGPGGPTAIPPDIVRPAQSTPEFVERRDPIVVPTLSPTPLGAANTAPDPRTAARATARIEAARMPVTALGIVTGSTTLYIAPADRGIVTIPAGEPVTVTGVSSDSRYYAAYTSAGQAGWIEASALTIFGGDGLAVVSNSFLPSAFATTLARAMQPVNVLDQLVAQNTPLPQEIDVNAAAQAIVNAESAAPLLPSFALPVNLLGAESTIATGRVQTDGGTLNVRAGSGTGFEVIGQVGDGQQVGVINFSDDGSWFEITDLESSGWVAAQYVVLE